MTKVTNRTTLSDYILAGTILVLSLASFGLAGFAGGASAATEVVVYVDGRLAVTADLADNRIISPVAQGLDMSVEIRDGRVRVLHSNCPHGLCRNAGSISRPGQAIVCVPNRVVIAIEGGAAPEYEAESY